MLRKKTGFQIRRMRYHDDNIHSIEEDPTGRRKEEG